MKSPALLVILLATANAVGADIDTMGGTLLHQVDPTLQGAGIPVAQPEAENGATGLFEVNPASSLVNQPVTLFTWISSAGTSNSYPNSLGGDSTHADFVAGNFYGLTNGVAQQVSHVDNYDADYFVNNYVANALPIAARVVNQSFIFSNPDGSHYPTNQEEMIDSQYDDYSAQYGTLFVSGAGNGGTVYPAATCYNGIGVGVYPGGSSVGPTPDGRSKPDLVSPGSGFTSFSTPFVSGSAAVLIQAGLRGDGGANTNAASDNRTVKALILNGAIKPSDWTNSVTTPLDAHYGAGVLNVFNSWHQLKGGKHPFIESTSVSSGNPHPPGANPGNEPVLTGWDFNSLTNADSSHDRINHYYFNLATNSVTLTATLVWQRPQSPSPGVMASINNLNLFLYNTANSNLVLCSTSTVDNVEHLFLPTLAPGRYDLQVQKIAHGEVSANETYALAFEFFNINLSITQSNGNAGITWPLAPAGFQLESTTNLSPPIAWSPVTNAVTVDTNASQNVVVVPATGINQFFRLQRP
ncbi:MAG TPA: S8 family serine peptidase [Verrucomicrobiae bacterium]|jgi:hypothetical protein